MLETACIEIFGIGRITTAGGSEFSEYADRRTPTLWAWYLLCFPDKDELRWEM
jgi:hypothetical protein